MLRFSLVKCPRFNFFPTAPKGDEVTAILVKVKHRYKIYNRLLKDKIELYQGIDLTL